MVLVLLTALRRTFSPHGTCDRHHLGLERDMGEVPDGVHRVLRDHPGHVGDFGAGVGVKGEVEAGQRILVVGQEILPE